MSIVIIGGNERMERRYADICKGYGHHAKVFTKMRGTFKSKLGKPDMLVLFTNTMSHKMVRGALNEIKTSSPIIERCHSSSATALKSILESYKKEVPACPAE